MYCPQCGTAHTPGGRFCGNCGILLPFAACSGEREPDAPSIVVDNANGASRPAHSPSRASLPTFTVAAVACVVAIGLALSAASAFVRSHTEDRSRSNANARFYPTSSARGAMGALLASERDASATPRSK